jgi:hypothetical protein
MLFINPTEVPLFVNSIGFFIVQAHLLFPPPLSRWQSPLPFTRPPLFVDWLIHYILTNCFSPYANIM